MQAETAFSDARAELQRYEALLRLTDSITRHGNLEDLFSEIASWLRKVTAFEVITFAIHDPSTNEMCVYRREGIGVCSPSDRISVDASPSGWVWQKQSPLVIPDLSSETRFPVVMRIWGEAGMRSFCAVPVTTARRRWGAFALGSRDKDRFTTKDLDFLRRIGDLIAVATENVSTFRALEEETQRLQALLEINASLVSSFDVQESFPAISGYIRKVVKQDFASISIYDDSAQAMRKFAIDCPDAPDIFHIGDACPAKGTKSGQAFLERETIIATRPEIEASHSPVMQKLAALGIQKICCIPLITRKGPLGSLNFGSRDDTAFSVRDVSLLKQIAAQLGIAVDNARTYSEIAKLKDRLSAEKAYLQGEIRSVLHFDEIVGESPALTSVLDQAKTVAPTDSTVLILGETGTGKELIARAIHRMSARKDGSFIKLNCAAIPTGLLESELFGHEKGAFTGAISQKVGRLELADKGTLFLDEVGDIPVELQPKLLRVLQDQEFERLGGTRTMRVNVRLVAATNRNLEADVANHHFRSDLFYRLNVFPIRMPALRERSGDIPLLVRFFIRNFTRRMNKKIDSIPTETMNALENWRWPGNVRELANFMERSIILSEGPVLRVPLAELVSYGQLSDESGTLERVEREHILRALRESGGVIAGMTGAAARLGLKRTTLQSKMQKMGITRRDYAN